VKANNRDRRGNRCRGFLVVKKKS